MRPPIIALIYPLQRKLSRRSVTNDGDSRNTPLSCSHLWEQYNKCVLVDANKCKDLHEMIMVKYKCPIWTP